MERDLNELLGKTISSILHGEGDWHEWLQVGFTDGTSIKIFGESGGSAGIIEVKAMSGQAQHGDNHCKLDDDDDYQYDIKYKQKEVD